MKGYEFSWNHEKNGLVVYNRETGHYLPFNEKAIDNSFIMRIDRAIQENYTETWESMSKIFPRMFERVEQFLKCNCSENDHFPDVDEDWNFQLERCICAYRGKCNWGFCSPKLNTELSERQFEIVEMFSKGMTQQEIADEMYLSERTIHNHFQNIYKKLGFVGMSKPEQQLMNYYNRKIKSIPPMLN